LPEQFPAPILRNDLQKAGGSKTIRLTRDDIAADFAAVAAFGSINRMAPFALFAFGSCAQFSGQSSLDATIAQ